MIKNIKYSVYALICAGLLSLTACDNKIVEIEVEQQKPDVEYTNTYDFGGDLYQIQSVVRNETLTTVEFWLSPVAGLTSINDVIAKGNYAVVCANKSYLGGRDLFQKTGSYIAFERQRKDNTDNAMAFIDMEIDGNYVFLNFKAEDLYINKIPAKKLFLGSYEGTFVNHEQILNNEWSYNRVVRSILSGQVLIKTITDENGNFLKDENGKFILTNTTTFILYDDAASIREAIRVEIPESKYGEDITELSDILSLNYDAGKTFELSSSANINKLLLSLDNDVATVNMDFVNGANLLSANFNGEVELVEEKPNHIICQTYDKVNGEWVKTPVPLIQEVHKLFVKKTDTFCELYFPTYAGAEIQYKESYTTLRVPADMVDTGYWFPATTTYGSFAYHNNDLNMDTDVPFGQTDEGSPADAQATVYVKFDGNNCKVVCRITDLFFTNSKIADVEVFYSGPISYE